MQRAWRASVLAAVLPAAALLVMAGPARAEWEGRASANLSEGATTNALAAPDGSSAVGADEFTTLRAGLSGNYTGLRQGQALGYTYSATFYANHPEGNAQNHLLDWSLEATPTADLTLHVAAAGTYGMLNSISPIAAAVALEPSVGTTVQVGAQPTGALTYYSANAFLGGSYKPTQSLLFQETTIFTTFQPTTTGEVPSSFAFSEVLRHEHDWPHGALSVDLSGGYMHSDALTTITDIDLLDTVNGFKIPEVSTVPLELMGGWRREFTPRLSSSAEVGALALHSFITGVTNVGPAARVQAGYQNLVSFADLLLAHQPQLNVFVGQTFVSDSASLRAALLLDRKQRFRVVAFAVAQHNSVLGAGGLSSALDVLSADVGFAYHPIAYPVQAAVEYSGTDQIGHRTGASSFPDLHRQVIMLTLTAAFGTNAPWGVAGAGELAPAATMH